MESIIDNKLVKNIHTYPLINLITLDTLLTGVIVWYIARHFHFSMRSAIVLLLAALLLNVAIHKVLGIDTALSKYVGV